MLPIPKKYYLTSGSAEGESELTAFDGALLNAGIGNVNLLKVSSILPPQADYVQKLELPPGALVPTAFGTIVSKKPGEVIAAAIAVGLSNDTFGIIMELVGKFSQQEAEEKIKDMVKESFELRKMELAEMKVSSAEHIVKRIGCAIAAAPMWY